MRGKFIRFKWILFLFLFWLFHPLQLKLMLSIIWIWHMRIMLEERVYNFTIRVCIKVPWVVFDSSIFLPKPTRIEFRIVLMYKRIRTVSSNWFDYLHWFDNSIWRNEVRFLSAWIKGEMLLFNQTNTFLNKNIMLFMCA